MRVSGQAERTSGARSVAARSGGGELRCPAHVAMVQTADFGNLQDRARLGELDGSDVGGVLVEREVRARLMIGREVPGPGCGAGVVRQEREHDPDIRAGSNR